jgi:predicted ribosomally synthesized peptide with SipW-like signal peptide
MRRTTLFSFLVIGVVLATVFGAGTFAPFTSQDDISGTVTAGDAEIDLADPTGGPDPLVFEPSLECGELTDDPQDECETDFTITNTGNLELFYGGVTATVTESGDDTTNCFEATLSFVSTTSGDSTGAVTGGTAAVPNNSSLQIQHSENAGQEGAGNADADSLDPTEVDTYNLDVNLVDAAAECQELIVTYTIDVTGTQSSSPHN